MYTQIVASIKHGHAVITARAATGEDTTRMNARLTRRLSVSLRWVVSLGLLASTLLLLSNASEPERRSSPAGAKSRSYVVLTCSVCSRPRSVPKKLRRRWELVMPPEDVMIVGLYGFSK